MQRFTPWEWGNQHWCWVGVRWCGYCWQHQQVLYQADLCRSLFQDLCWLAVSGWLVPATVLAPPIVNITWDYFFFFSSKTLTRQPNDLAWPHPYKSFFWLLLNPIRALCTAPPINPFFFSQKSSNFKWMLRLNRPRGWWEEPNCWFISDSTVFPKPVFLLFPFC